MRRSIPAVSTALALTCAALLASPAAARAEEPERCRRGIESLAAKDPASAHALLEHCEGAEARRARARARKQLETGDFAPVNIAVPEDAIVEVSALPGQRFHGSVVLWLPFGEHELRVTAPGRLEYRETISIEDRSRLALLVELEEAKPAGQGGRDIDFGDEGNGAAVGDPITAIDPRPKKHESIMPERFRRAPDPREPSPDGDRVSSPPYLPFYIAGGLALVAGVTVHVVAGDTRARYAAYGLYGLGAAGVGAGAYFHWRRRRTSYAPAPVARGAGALVWFACPLR